MTHPRLEFVEMAKKQSNYDDNFAGNCSIPDDDSLPTVEVLHRYRHRGSGRIYLVSELLPMCDGEEWVDGVLYMSVESGERFVQPLERFKRKMEKVDVSINTVTIRAYPQTSRRMPDRA